MPADRANAARKTSVDRRKERLLGMAGLRGEEEVMAESVARLPGPSAPLGFAQGADVNLVLRSSRAGLLVNEIVQGEVVGLDSSEPRLYTPFPGDRKVDSACESR